MKSKVVILLVMFCAVSTMAFAQKENSKDKTNGKKVELICFVNTQDSQKRYMTVDRVHPNFKDSFSREVVKDRKSRESAQKLTESDRQLLVSLSLEYENLNY